MNVIEAPAETTSLPVTRRDVLHRAANLLEEFGWCQDELARNERGTPVDPCARTTASFCVEGAIIRASVDLTYPVLYEDAMGAFARATQYDILGWNDNPSRTKAEVVARLRAAADASPL